LLSEERHAPTKTFLTREKSTRVFKGPDLDLCLNWWQLSLLQLRFLRLYLNYRLVLVIGIRDAFRTRRYSALFAIVNSSTNGDLSIIGDSSVIDNLPTGPPEGDRGGGRAREAEKGENGFRSREFAGFRPRKFVAGRMF
jgi:hypothetical protein